MALEGMHRELLCHLQAKRAAHLLIGAWEDAWREALADPAEAVPCPECFLKGRTSKLHALSSYGNLGQARCPDCHTVFMFVNN
ncbi:hypothetical protein [Variovorax sp. WDL1]|uniref:hypothetical protein n=1 Tax=Variovorax sp. WDL1 TaxID=207745 RepID=UPI000A80AF58|nr:hypothetical protein [Variovorax sp. WDL1]